jgi:hypothetical protein
MSKKAGCFGWVAFITLLIAMLVTWYLMNLTMM